MDSSTDFSMASVDTNPTFDQYDDGGSSLDFSALLSQAASVGGEIAQAVNGGPQYYQSVPAIPQGSLSLAGYAPKKNNAGLILLVIVSIGVVWYMSQN
jgi:hypothetical protein